MHQHDEPDHHGPHHHHHDDNDMPSDLALKVKALTSLMAPRLAPCSAARISRVWLAGAACTRRSVARCCRAAPFCSISAATWPGSSICASRP